MLRTCFTVFFMLLAFSGSAQNDTYILRDHTTGKNVKPAVPPRKRITAVVKPSPVVPRGTAESSVNGVSPLAAWAHKSLNYPVGALRAGVEGTIFLLLSVAPDGHVADVVFKQFVAPGGTVLSGPYAPPKSAIADLVAEAERVFRSARFEPATVATEEEVHCAFRIM